MEALTQEGLVRSQHEPRLVMEILREEAGGAGEWEVTESVVCLV